MIYMKLVKYLFYILMLLGVTGVWAQKSDIRLGKLLNNGDWFTLEEEYPTGKVKQLALNITKEVNFMPRMILTSFLYDINLLRLSS